MASQVRVTEAQVILRSKNNPLATTVTGPMTPGAAAEMAFRVDPDADFTATVQHREIITTTTDWKDAR